MINIDYAFISKDDIELKCGLSIKQYSIDEIEKSVGYNRYEKILWSMSRHPYEFKFDLEDNGVDFKEVTSYDIFLMINANRQVQEVLEEFKFIFGEDFNGYSDEGTTVFISDKGNKINRDTLPEIMDVVYKMFFFDKPRERKPANEEAKKLIKKQLKLQAKQRVKYDIYSIVEGIVWHENSSYKYEDIIQLTPRQIYSGYRSIKKIKEFNNTIDGIYSGVINSKDVDFNKINWINKE